MLKQKTNLWLVIMVVVIALGFGLRLVRLSKAPASMYWDEVSLGYEAYSVARTGLDSHGNSWLQAFFPAYGDYKAPVYIWLTALWLKVLPLTIFTTRLTSALAGALSVVGVYLLARQLFRHQSEKVLAIAASAAVAICPWSLQFSRAAFEANVAAALGIWAIWALLAARKQPWLAVLASGLAAASVYTYVSNRFVLPVVGILVVGLYAKNYKSAWRWLALGGVVFGLLLVPLLQSPHYAVSNQYRLSTDSVLKNETEILVAQRLRDRHQNSLLSRLIYHRYWFTSRELALNVVDHLTLDYLFLRGDPQLRHSTGVTGVFYPSLVVLLGLGLYSLAKGSTRELALILGAWFIALIPAAIPEETPHALRSLNALPWIALVIGSGAALLWQRRQELLAKLTIVLVSGWLLFDVTSYLYYYHFDYPVDSQDAWLTSYTQAAQYIVADERQSFSIYSTIDQNFLLYLLFYGRIDPTVSQLASQSQTFASPYNLRVPQFDRYHLAETLESIQGVNGPGLALLRTDQVPAGMTPLARFPDGSDSPTLAVVRLPLARLNTTDE